MISSLLMTKHSGNAQVKSEPLAAPPLWATLGKQQDSPAHPLATSARKADALPSACCLCSTVFTRLKNRENQV